MKLSVGTVGRLGEMNKQNTNDLCLLCYLAIVLPGEDECLLYLLNWDWRLESEIKSAQQYCFFEPFYSLFCISFMGWGFDMKVYLQEMVNCEN